MAEATPVLPSNRTWVLLVVGVVIELLGPAGVLLWWAPVLGATFVFAGLWLFWKARRDAR